MTDRQAHTVVVDVNTLSIDAVVERRRRHSSRNEDNSALSEVISSVRAT